jgi:hypothetical protein
MTCLFCSRPIVPTTFMLMPNVDNPKEPHYYHVHEDEQGNAAPNMGRSCWGHSAQGNRTLDQYFAENEP